VHGTYKDAQKALTKLLGDSDAGMLPDRNQDTVGTFLTNYLDAALDLAPKTLERYQELAQRQVIPHLGSVKLQKLKPADVGAWHAALIATGLAPRTVGHAHRVLSVALRRAVDDGVLARNVAAIRKPPAVEAVEVHILTPDQVTAVLEALRGHSLYPIAALALGTGMRRGELLALEWSDVDLDRAVLAVTKSVEETKAGLRIKPPKSKRGRRTVSLAADAVAMLRTHRADALRIRLALGQGGAPRLVFGTLDDALMAPNGVSRSWRQTCRAKKLPRVPFHALRHTHVSTLIAAGVNILTISRRIGHSSAAMTLDVYGHLVEGSDAMAAKAIEGMLK
jgi:integrase